jgi:pyrroloquinoline quinone biosynthesis protein D
VIENTTRRQSYIATKPAFSDASIPGTPAPSCRPRLAPGCRLSDAPGQDATLLLPERALRLNPTGVKIVERCDGSHTFAEIVADLAAQFTAAQREVIEAEAAAFLEKLHQSGAVEFL